MAKISNNKIPNIDTDWSLDPDNGLPYSGQSVQSFIKSQLKEGKEKAAAFFYDSEANMFYAFRTEEDKDLWMAGRDEQYVLSSTALTFSGTVYAMDGIDLSNADGGKIYYPSVSDTAMLTVGYRSLRKRIIDTEFEEVRENAYFTVEIDRSGNGEYEVIVNQQLVIYGSNFEYNIRKQLNPGDNTVKVTIVGASTNASTFLIYTLNLTSMYLADADFKWYNTFVEGQVYNLGGMFIGGNIAKTLHVKVSNEELGYTKQYDKALGTTIYTTNAYYFEGMEFPDTGSGVYQLELWVNSEGFETDHLYYNIICVSKEDAATAKFVTVNNICSKVINFSETTVFDYCVYDSGSTTASPTLMTKFQDRTLTEEILNNIATNTKHTYKVALEIESDEQNINLNVSITNGNQINLTLPIDNSASFPAVPGAVFYLNAAERNNAQSNKDFVIDSISGTNYETTWTNLTWTDGYNGWTVDDEGRKCLAIPAMAKANINYQPLSSLPNTGRTLEFVFKVSNIANYEEPIIQIFDGTSDNFKGLLIKPTQIMLKSRDKKSDLTQSYNFKENEVIDLTIAIARNYKVTYGNLAMIYANGVKVCEFEFESSDDWTVSSNVIFGAESSDLFLYKMRVYDNAFESTSALTNYLNSLPTPEEKITESIRINSIVDDSGIIDYGLVSAKYNTMVVEMTSVDEIPHYGWEKERHELCNFEMIYPENKEWGFKIDNVRIEGQGTTSMNYWLWNLRIRLDKSDDATVTYNNGTVDTSGKLWFDGENNHPKINRITAKKNYASSMHSHKMGATGAFNDLHHALGLDNEVGGRVAVYQYPVYAFQKSLKEGSKTDYVYNFIGLYTIGPDKGDKPTFGYDNSTYKKQLMHLEGTDHAIKGVGFDYPYNEMKYVADKEALCVDKGNDAYDAGWEVGASGAAETEAEIQAYLDQEFKPAYESSYNNSTMILGTSDSIESINLDPTSWGLQKTSDGHLYQRFDIWIDGEYDVYFFSKKTNKYEKNGINLLTQLNVTSSELSGLTVDQKNELFKERRRTKFKEVASNYWDIQDCLFCYCFLVLFGATDNFKKNSYPYKFGNLADGHRWKWRQDDLDTIFDIDNQGHSTKKYSIEAHDWSDNTKAAYVFKGEDSSFWRLLGECYEVEIKAMMHNIFAAMETLSENTGNRLEKQIGFIEKYFWGKAQHYFTRSAYNLDGATSYEEAWPQYKAGNYVVDVHPLDQAMGYHLETERAWVEKRMIYMMSKFQYGAFENYRDDYLGVITFRTQNGQNFEITPAMDLYPTILLGQGGSATCGRINDGESAVIQNVGGSDTNVYLMAADYLKDIGDLSNITVNPGANITLGINAKRIWRIKVGDEVASNVTSNLTSLSVGDCPSVKVVDARNLTTLTGNVDLTQCPRLQEALFGGTSVTSVDIPVGSTIKRLQLPSTVTVLKLRNLEHLESFEYEDLTHVEYLWIENCPAINAFEILKTIYNSDNNNLKDVRIVGINETMDMADVAIFASLANNLDKNGNYHKYNGISSTGESSTDLLPVIEGTIDAHQGMHEVDYNSIMETFLGLKINVNVLYFKFEDPLVESIVVNKWSSNAPYGIKESEIAKITDIGSVFINTNIKSFNEFAIFPINKVDTSLNHKDWFYGCANLEKIKLPKSLSGNFVKNTSNYQSTYYWFEGCSSLKEIFIPSGLYMQHLLRDCDNIKKVYTDNVANLAGFYTIYSLLNDNASATLYENEKIVSEINFISNTFFYFGFNNKWVVKPESTTLSFKSKSFKNCTILNDISVSISGNYSMVFQNCIFEGNFNLRTMSYGNLSPCFYKCTFKQNIYLSGNISLNNSTNLVPGEPAFSECVIPSVIYVSDDFQISTQRTTNKLFPDLIDVIVKPDIKLIDSNWKTIISRIIFEDRQKCLSWDTYEKLSSDFVFYYLNDKQEVLEWTESIDYVVDHNYIGSYSTLSFGSLIKSVSQTTPILSIGEGAFLNTYDQFANLDFSGVENVGKNAFKSVKWIPDITWDNLKTLAYGAFHYSNISTVNLTNITKIPDFCFSDCENLSVLNFQNVTNLGSNAFAYSSVTSLDLSNIVSFQNTTMTASSNPLSTQWVFRAINFSATFNKYSTQKKYYDHFKEIHLKDYSLLNQQFSVSSNTKNDIYVNGVLLTEIKDESWTYLHKHAFSWSNSIQKASFKNVVTIDEGVFYESSYLDQIICGSSLTSIGAGFLHSNVSATYVKDIITRHPNMIFLSTSPPVLSGGLHYSTASYQHGKKSCLSIFVPDESVDLYKSATNWSEYSNQIYPISNYFEWENLTDQLVSGYYTTPQFSLGTEHLLTFVEDTAYKTIKLECKPGDVWVAVGSFYNSVYLDSQNMIVSSITTPSTNGTEYIVPENCYFIILNFRVTSTMGLGVKTYKTFEKPW